MGYSSKKNQGSSRSLDALLDLFLKLDAADKPQSIMASVCRALEKTFCVTSVCAVCFQKPQEEAVRSIWLCHNVNSKQDRTIVDVLGSESGAARPNVWSATEENHRVRIIEVVHAEFDYDHYFILRPSTWPDNSVQYETAKQVVKTAFLLLMRQRSVKSQKGFLEVITHLLAASREKHQDLHQIILESSGHIISSEHSCIWLADVDTDGLYLRAAAGLPVEVFEPSISLSKSVTGECLREGHPIFYENCRDQAFLQKFRNKNKIRRLQITSMLAIPVSGEANGVQAASYAITFFFTSKYERPAQGQIALLQHHLPSIFQLTSLFDERRLAVEFQNRKASSPPRREYEPAGRANDFRQILEDLCRSLPCDRAYLFVADPQSNRYSLSSYGFRTPEESELSDRVESLYLSTLVLADQNDEVFYQAASGRCQIVDPIDPAWSPFEVLSENVGGGKGRDGFSGARNAAIVPLGNATEVNRGYLICVDKQCPLDSSRTEPFSRDDLAFVARYARLLVPSVDQRQFEQRLAARVAAGVHELGHPVTSVADYIDFWLMSPEKAGHAGQLREIQDHLNLAKIICRSIRLSGPSPGSALDLSDFEFRRDVLDFVYSAVKPIARVKNVLFDNIEFRGAGRLRVHSDKQLLRQVFFNLLSNAVKYVGERGEKGFRVEVYYDLRSSRNDSAAGSPVIFASVEDYGIGIDEPDASRIFDFGYRSNSAREVDARGMGIGLAVTQRILQQLGGQIELQRFRGPTRFVLEFPVRVTLANGLLGE